MVARFRRSASGVPHRRVDDCVRAIRLVRLGNVCSCAACLRAGLGVPEMEKLDGYLRIKEAAEFLGVSPNTLRNWGRDGKITEQRHPMNNYRLYKKTDLERLLRLTEKPRT